MSAAANEVCQWLAYRRDGWPKSVTRLERADVYTSAIDMINHQTKEIEQLRREREDLRMSLSCISCISRDIVEILKK